MSTTLEVRERPILFSGPMVRAILEGRKAQTRRVVKPQPEHPHVFRALNGAEWCGDPGVFLWDARWEDERGRHGAFVGEARCPYGQPGDRLWCREAHAIVPRTAYRCSDGVQQTLRPDDNHDAAVYREGWTRSQPGRWRPSIHMPRWASRISLEITDVRVERVQEISREDAIAEGARHFPEIPTDHPYVGCAARWSMESPTHTNQCLGSPQTAFWNLWNKINGPRGYSFESNPWVWVISFRVLAPTPALES